MTYAEKASYESSPSCMCRYKWKPRQFLCSVLQCVAVCCSVLQCVAVCCSMLQCVLVCRSVCVYIILETCARHHCLLQCVAACCSVVQFTAVCRSVLQCVCAQHPRNAGQASLFFAVCCSVVQCGTAWGSVLQCVAVCCSACVYNILEMRARHHLRRYKWTPIYI